MAVSLTNDHTEWFDFDADSGIVFDGNVWGSGDGASTIFFVEGSGSMNAQNKATGRGGMGHSKGSTTISGHMHGWVNTLDIPADAPAGWAMRFSSSDSWDTNYASFNCGGADTNRIIVNRFQPFCADVTATPDRSSSPPALSSVTVMWMETDATTNSGQKTVFVDRMFFGTVTRVQGGTTGARGTAAQIAADSAALPVFINVGGVYYVIDGLEWGITTASDSFFEDEGETLVFESQPQIANDFYNLAFVGNSGQTNICTFGNKTGTGITATGSGGYTFKSGGTQPFSFTATDNNITLGVYGCNFLNSSTTGATWSITNTDSEHFSNLYDACPEITIGTGVEFRHNTITNSSASSSEGAIEMGAVNPGTSDAVRDLNISGAINGMGFTGTGNRTIDLKNIVFANNTDHVRIDHGGGDTVTINLSEGSTALSAGDINNVNSSTINIVNAVTITVGGLTEGASVVVVALETVGTITTGDIILQGLADTNGVVEDTGFNYQGAFDPSGLDVNVDARGQGLPTAAIADDNGSFTDETDEANSATTSDMTLMPATAVATQDSYIFGHNEEFGTLKLDISSEATGTPTIQWQYWNGSWTALSGVVDGTDNLLNAGENKVTWTIPGDWADTTINGQGPYKFVRAHFLSGTITSSGVAGTKVALDVTRYLPFTQDRVISSTGLTVVATWVEDTISIF